MKFVKTIVIPTVVLMLFAAIMSGLLALTYQLTGVANLPTGLSEDDLKEIAPVVLPGSDTLTLVEIASENPDLLGVYQNSTKDGVAIYFKTAGYAGKSDPIEAVVGFDQEGVIQGITVVACAETPGLGTKVENPEYLQNYVGVSQSVDAVDTITSATISSTALKNGVQNAMQCFEEIKEEVFA